MGIQLKPCPFCGSEAAFKVGYHMKVDAKVGCDECGAEGPVFGTDANSGDFRPQAADAWNRRTDEELTRLRAEPAAKSKDAARYQFIRDADRSDDVIGYEDILMYAGDSLDAAIDSAMGEGNGR